MKTKMTGVAWFAGMCLTLLLAAAPARATLTWTWSYTGTGISAAGAFVTGDIPDSSGSYLITDISGLRNGVAITGLQPTGTPIPGNEPFAVDNLVSPATPHLTTNGFGYALADGSHANPFWADFLPGYIEFYAAPAANALVGPAETSEAPISFQASLIPEPATFVLLALSCAAFGLARTHRQRALAPA